MDLIKTISIAAAGMRVQGQRMQITSENVANANSLATNPETDPYRRKVVLFRNALDDELGVRLVKLYKVQEDNSEFGLRFDPQHPSANENGYVQTPNVNAILEMMDMKEAQRSYEANLSMINTAKSMLMKTIGLIGRG